MSCLGVHFAITQQEADCLRSIGDEQERLEYLQGRIEKEYFEQYPELKAESDKSWDAMHRALADGELTWSGGVYPLNHTVLAGELLYTGTDYIMSLKAPEQVQDISAALEQLDEGSFRSRYLSINPRTYDAELSEQDFQYTWGWFQGVRALYRRASQEERFVLFTADQ